MSEPDENGWHRPSGEYKPRRRLFSTPWPALDDVLDLVLPRLIVLALPAEPNSETAFHIAQAAAQQGVNPLCLFPGWSPYWDGTLHVRRSEPVTLRGLDALDVSGHGLVILDQFSRIHWRQEAPGIPMEDAVTRAGEDLLGLGRNWKKPVLVMVRRPKGPDPSICELRAMGALEYGADTIVMVQPEPDTGTAILHVAKHRRGPSRYTARVEWEALPRTLWPEKAP